MLKMSYILYWHGRDFGQYFLPILVLQYFSKKFWIVNQHFGASHQVIIEKNNRAHNN